MAIPDSKGGDQTFSAKVNAGALGATAILPAPDESQIPAKAKEHNIRVSPAVLDAAGKGRGRLASLLAHGVRGPDAKRGRLESAHSGAE